MIDEWIHQDIVKLGLSTLDYLPIVEVNGTNGMSAYEGELLERRHDKRMETELIDAMYPDWGDSSWYTTPAAAYAREHGSNAFLGIVLRTPCARYARQTVGKIELYNLHGLA